MSFSRSEKKEDCKTKLWTPSRDQKCGSRYGFWLEIVKISGEILRSVCSRGGSLFQEVFLVGQNYTAQRIRIPFTILWYEWSHAVWRKMSRSINNSSNASRSALKGEVAISTLNTNRVKKIILSETYFLGLANILGSL